MTLYGVEKFITKKEFVIITIMKLVKVYKWNFEEEEIISRSYACI
jgi:hypothetical protein